MSIIKQKDEIFAPLKIDYLLILGAKDKFKLALQVRKGQNHFTMSLGWLSKNIQNKFDFIGPENCWNVAKII